MQSELYEVCVSSTEQNLEEEWTAGADACMSFQRGTLNIDFSLFQYARLSMYVLLCYFDLHIYL